MVDEWENTHVVSRMTVGVSDKTRLFNEWNRSCVSPSPRSCCSSVVCHHRQTPLELFQKLQPVSHLFGEPACDTSISDCSDGCSEGTCHTSGCRSHSCGCRTAPAPTMIGGSSLGVPFSDVCKTQVRYTISQTFTPAWPRTIRPSRRIASTSSTSF